MKAIAIIPARGGSKGIPKKNIKLLAGKPLIVYTIEQALASEVVDRVIVSTDDPEIKEISERHGAEVVDRPPELARDDSASEPVLLHVLETLRNNNYEPDIIVFLQCTSPFRRKSDIDNAIKLFIKGNFDAVTSVFESKWFIWRNISSAIPINFEIKNIQRRQDREKEYTEIGSIFVLNRKMFEKEKTRVFGKIGLYVMPQLYSFEIDTILDFQIADYVAKNILK